MHHHAPSEDSRLQARSLFSGYGGLNFAVKHVFNAETIWFFEIDEPSPGSSPTTGPTRRT